jgi:hypothetical protein
MHFRRTLSIVPAQIGFAFLLSVISCFSLASLARSAQPTIPSPASETPDLVSKHGDMPYNKPIIFFEENTQILVFYPNGDIIHRGRKVTNDRAVVQALQEILRLSPCRKDK